MNATPRGRAYQSAMANSDKQKTPGSTTTKPWNAP